MENLNFKQTREAFVDIIEKITAVDPIGGAYLARHIILNEMKETIKYVGSEAVLKRIMDRIKIIEN